MTQHATQNPTVRDMDRRSPEAHGHFHIHLTEDHSGEAIRAALEAAGIPASAITPTTHEREGVIMTKQMASFTWDSQTGVNNCYGSCREDGPPHRNYQDLSSVQQHRFTDRVLYVMNEARGETEMNLGEMSSLGPPVRTTECS